MSDEDPSVRMCRENWQAGGYCVPCIVERGAFSSERLFRFHSANEEIIGLCDMSHIFNAQCRPIDLSWPESPAMGFVRCIRLAQNDTHVAIEVAGGDRCTVAREFITEYGPRANPPKVSI